jgi:hypothetical protein
VGTEAFAALAAGGIPLAPLDYALHQPYPNPTRGAAVIPFDLAERGPVTLAVYDLLGRRLVVLVDGVRDGGRYEAALDGASLPSGVYLVRLTAGGETRTRRVTLLR